MIIFNNSREIFNGKSFVIRVVALCWILMKLLCYKLWLSNRLFPLVPVHDALLQIPSNVQLAIFLLSLTGMIALLFIPNKKSLLVFICLLELSSCLLDQNRWQPWEYQFLFMMLLLIISKKESDTLSGWQLIVSGLYFFSGLAKLNSAFIHDVWQNLVLQRLLGLSLPGIWITRLGYGVPVGEMLAGLALLWPPSRRLAVILLCSMHLFVLLLLGPTGLAINSVVWPWNLAMPILLYVLFFKTKFNLNPKGFYQPVIMLAVFFWWLLPVFQLRGYWDKYLSSVLYGGGVEQVYICTTDPKALADMQPYLDKSFGPVPCTPVLSLYKWGMAEMNTAPYPEPRVNRSIIRYWQKRYPGNNSRFYLFKPGFSWKLAPILPD